MKILIVSDTHMVGREYIKDIYQEETHDLLICLGDEISDLYSLLNENKGIEFYAVKGNCDSYFDKKNPELLIKTIKGKKIMMTHGHNYGVKKDYDLIKEKAIEEEADIVLFGHTHNQHYEEFDNGKILFNPGSLGDDGSYGILEILENGTVSIKHYKFEV